MPVIKIILWLLLACLALGLLYSVLKNGRLKPWG